MVDKDNYATARSWDAVGRLTLSESLRCVRLVLWHEGRQRLISFRDLRRRAV
jgi:acyl-lipid omega-6 desaturase (Delta-12 desaturase)